MPLSAQKQLKLDRFIQDINDKSTSFMGYPISTDFDYQQLTELINYPLNNLGDPFAKSTWQVDSREFECEVIEFFANLFRAPEDDWWGYVTNGSTEANLYALYLARELYPKGICYFSKETHYSVAKNLHLLNMPHIMIQSDDKGVIDYDDLREKLEDNKDLPAIIFSNSGTTMTEAKDDIKKIRIILEELSISKNYIHSDSALCGAINPFLTPRPSFDFEDGADSVSLSGHKFIGSPVPCGVIIARKSNVDRIARSIAYIGCLDTTISGSRNGFTPMVLWHAINCLGIDGIKKRVFHSLSIAEYTEKKLKNIGIKAWRNPNSITVVFPEVSEFIKNKYQLATANGQTHIICMPNMKTSDIDNFILELNRNIKNTFRDEIPTPCLIEI